ncbi:MAG: tryptophan synthase subunit alpha [Salinisphaera sp.]|nr:tryptophan synthase subunit alpha [Salinisphaera sp.]
MSRLAACFDRLRAEGRCGLIPYITAGDPHPDLSVTLMHALVDAGADVFELGVPFSDPMAEGPVIQAACERALAHGTSMRDVLATVSAFRCDDDTTPVVLMGYFNPIEAMGLEAFAADAAAAGVDAVLVVDLPAEEASDVAPVLRAAGLDCILLVAPTTAELRLPAVCAHASGFLYYVSLKGVTGAQSLDVSGLDRRLTTLRAHSDLPVAVGFGIRTPEAAAAVAQVADAVVVGSALVARIADIGADRERLVAEVPDLLRAMRQAMDTKKESA